jgi:hypothetical protein
VKLFGLAFGQDRSFDIYLALSPMANLKRKDLIGHLEKQLPTMVVFVSSPSARLDISHHTDAI